MSDDISDPIAADSAQEKLDRRPLLDPRCQILLNWFSEISRRRPQSMVGVPCAIPSTEIEAFYRMQELRRVIDAQEFWEWMVFLDNVLIEYYMEQDSKKKAAEDAKRNYIRDQD